MFLFHFCHHIFKNVSGRGVGLPLVKSSARAMKISDCLIVFFVANCKFFNVLVFVVGQHNICDDTVIVRVHKNLIRELYFSKRVLFKYVVKSLRSGAVKGARVGVGVYRPKIQHVTEESVDAVRITHEIRPVLAVKIHFVGVIRDLCSVCEC